MPSINDVLTHDVKNTYLLYPPPIQTKLLTLRQLIMDVAFESEDIGELEEALKWGEPSYLTKNGSTIRIAWKKSEPGEYALYFNCKTKLVDTFKELYLDTFKFEGNRAIIFEVNQKIPTEQIKHCILLALTYHKIKHLPLLGA